MIDLGLTTGIKDLWQENLLRDYTLVVEGQEFQVHKVVLAAVSLYFKAMIGRGFMESKTDKVEVRGFSADVVGNLLDFIYTGEEGAIADNTLEVLRCSMYLQMPQVSEFCAKKLVEILDVRNCLQILSTLKEFTFQEELKEVTEFVWNHLDVLLATCQPDDMSLDVVHILIDSWKMSELYLFRFLKNWVFREYENHIMYMNDLMARVRYCLIGPDKLQDIMQMDVFSNTEGSWKDLVLKAMRYHQLPMNLKVLDNSEQSCVRTERLPAFLVNSGPDDRVTCFALNRQSTWKKHAVAEFDTSGPVNCFDTVCLQVNNFLVVCATIDKTIGSLRQEWYIFDPRTMTWAKMPNMEKPKIGFTMVHHNEHLYVVGGQALPKVLLVETEQYSFLTNEWSTICDLPTSLCLAAACVLGDVMYISGGYVDVEGVLMKDKSVGLYCLNLLSQSHEWEQRAPCLYRCGDHRMFVGKRHREEVLFIIDKDLSIQIYSPSTDQWSEFTNTLIPEGYNASWLEHGVLVANGNSVFVLNVDSRGDESDDEEEEEDSTHKKHACWKWDIPECGTAMSEVTLEDFPQIVQWQPNICAALLSITPQPS